MKLADLNPTFVVCTLRGPNSMRHQGTIPPSPLAADGLMFDHPDNPTTSVRVLLWKPVIPPTVSPPGGRWEMTGTNLSDVTVTPEIILDSESWTITNGEIIPTPP